MYLTALPPTDSVTHGLLPAAAGLGADVTLLTDRPDVHRAMRYGGVDEIVGCDVRDPRAVIDTIERLSPRHGRPDAVFSNSDHLQVETALAAGYFDVPTKDWRACLTAKNKFLMRRRLEAAGVERVRSAVLEPGDDTMPDIPMPVVVKPREGVASEDVVFVDDVAHVPGVVGAIRSRRPHAALVVEEYLAGPVFTVETVGDGRVRRVLGGFATTLGPLPHFVEERLDWCPDRDVGHVLSALDAVGVGLGACHTEYVVTPDGPRIVEINYRLIGDTCDFLLADVLGVDVFGAVLRAHLGLPLDVAAAAGTRHGAAVSIVAGSSGTVIAAPPDVPDGTLDSRGVRVRHRALRACGDRVEVTHTNRDYLGIVRAVGPDRTAVDAAIATFAADHPWEIG